MKFLLKVRLSYYFFILLVIYLVVAFSVKGTKFESGALTLFSVNSFLYGFYIAPILSGQKGRIDDLQKNIRAEANALFTMLLKTKKLSTETRNRFQDMYVDYMKASFVERKPAEGEDEYEKLIGVALNYEGKDADKVDKLLDGLVSNQSNRSQLSMLLNNKVYSNEWWVILVLFSITLGFVMFLDIGTQWQMKIVKALLCTGLTMLLVILVKLSTLTHKKAKQLWDPLQKLLDTRFYRVD
jgi:hypothetical protein